MIFVVEENKGLNEAFCKYLYEHGLPCVGVDSVVVALGHLEVTTVPQFMILDLNLLKNTSADLVEYLSLPIYQDMAVILVSVNSFMRKHYLEPSYPRRLNAMMTAMLHLA